MHSLNEISFFSVALLNWRKFVFFSLSSKLYKYISIHGLALALALLLLSFCFICSHTTTIISFQLMVVYHLMKMTIDMCMCWTIATNIIISYHSIWRMTSTILCFQVNLKSYQTPLSTTMAAVIRTMLLQIWIQRFKIIQPQAIPIHLTRFYMKGEY